MPFFDQHWRLRLLGAGMAAVAAVLFPLHYLQVTVVWDHLRGWDMQPDYLFAGFSAVALVVVAVLLVQSARRARERMLWRMEMLTGVYPREHTSSHGALAASSALERHTIVLRTSKFDRIFAWVFLPFFILFSLGAMLVLALGLAVLINPAALAFQGAFGFLLIAPAMLITLWVFGTLASDAWVPVPRYEIDPFGITWMRPRGRNVTIRWQDARLLESTAYYRPAGNRIERQVRYLLYGNDTVIRIDRKLGNYVVMRQLLELIKDHTGLVPYTLDQPSFRERTFRRSRLSSVES